MVQLMKHALLQHVNCCGGEGGGILFYQGYVDDILYALTNIFYDFQTVIENSNFCFTLGPYMLFWSSI